MNMARAIRTVMAARGLRQRELAEQLGVDEAQISRVLDTRPERTAKTATLKTYQSIASALDVPLYLLVLLASDAEDLGPHDTKALGERLLQVLISHRAAHKTSEKRVGLIVENCPNLNAPCARCKARQRCVDAVERLIAIVRVLVPLAAVAQARRLAASTRRAGPTRRSSHPAHKDKRIAMIFDIGDQWYWDADEPGCTGGPGTRAEMIAAAEALGYEIETSETIARDLPQEVI